MNQLQLLDTLRSEFSEQELDLICRRMQIATAELDQSSHSARVFSLVAFCRENGRLPELLAEMSQIQPHLNLVDDESDHLKWLDEIAAGFGEVNKPQITSQANKLKGILDPAAPEATAPTPEMALPSPPASARQSAPAPELPTARWEDAEQALSLTGQPSARNPYHAGRLVTEKEMFFGRQAERQRIKARLEKKGSSVIVGPRRIGKSSLLYYLTHHETFNPTYRFLFAYLDLQNGRFTTLPALIQETLAQWQTASGQMKNLRTQNLADFTAGVQTLAAAGWRPVLALDGFSHLAQHPNQFNDALFAAWYALGSSGKLAFLLTSRQPVASLLPQEGPAAQFAALFDQLNLGLLDPASAAALARKPALRHAVLMPAAAIDELQRLGGVHPFYLQMAGRHLVNQLRLGPYQPSQFVQDFLHEAEPYWRRLWEELPAFQQKLLADGIQSDPPLVIERQYRQLAQEGILWQDGQGYKTFSAAFTAWVKTEYGPRETAVPSPSPDPEPPTTGMLKLRRLLPKKPGLRK